ncbi:MAG: hypothetical protein QXI91_06530 [Candidatus Bathyarchaeia archaeon]
MSKSNQIKHIHIYLPKELADWVKQQAEKENRKISNYIATIILKIKNGEPT